MLRYWQTSGATTREGITVGHSFLFEDLFASFGAQWTMKQFNVARTRNVTDVHDIFGRCRFIVGTSSGLSNFFQDGKHVSGTYEWDADPDEYEEEEQEWVEEADAYFGNDDERDKDVPEVDVALSTEEMETALQLKVQRVVFHGRQEVGGSSESSSTRILFPMWLEWVPFGGLHSMTPRACNKASGRKKYFSVNISWSWTG